MPKKSYCTQNGGDCTSCSLVNYGRDCRNNPVQYPMTKYNVYLQPNLLQAIQDLARDDNKTTAELIRHALTEYIKKNR